MDTELETEHQEEGGAQPPVQPETCGAAGQRSLRSPAPSQPSEDPDVKKSKKKASNATYYKKIREKLKQADESPEISSERSSEPKPKTKAKPKQTENSESPKTTPRKKRRVTPPVSPKAVSPASPRTRMIEAYREARLADQERKRLRYKSWFN